MLDNLPQVIQLVSGRPRIPGLNPGQSGSRITLLITHLSDDSAIYSCWPNMIETIEFLVTL